MAGVLSHVRLVALAAAAALGLGGSRTADAAEGACLGSWRFELAPPGAEKEAWVSPESWCRANRLPKSLVVQIRRDDGRVVMTGEPLRPSDVLIGAGKCEFEFVGPASGIAKNHELFIEVNEAGAVVHGTARCSERSPGPDGTSTGVTIDLAVTGSRAGAEGSAMGPGPLVARVVTACRQQNADALWRLMTARFQSEVDQRAAELRRLLTAAELRRLYRHRGRTQAFTGLAYLRGAMAAADAADNPCSGASHWQVGPGTPSEGGWLVAVQRGEGYAFSLRFSRGDRGWLLDQISKSVRAPKP